MCICIFVSSFVQGSKAKGASDKKGKAEKQQSKKLDKEGAKDQ